MAADIAGILDHLVERYSQLDKPASYVVSGSVGEEVRATLTFWHVEQQREVSVTGAGKTIEEAAENLRSILNKPLELPKAKKARVSA